MYLKLKNNIIEKYPYTTAELIAENPGVSFPQSLSESLLAEYGVFPVEVVTSPTADHTQNLTEETPILVNGVWKQNWLVSPASTQEVADRTDEQAGNIRNKRNEKLTDCDWTQLPDSPVDKATWAVYRQELRDVTNQAGFPWEVIWPTQP